MPRAASENSDRRKRIRTALLYFVAVTHLLLLDQLAKRIAVAFFAKGHVCVIDGLFNLAYVENRGCAWGMLQGNSLPLALFGFVAFVFLAIKRKAIFALPEKMRFMSHRAAKHSLAVAEAFIYAGIAGNMLDRLFRGYVVDFLDFHWGVHHFPCFNIADAYITTAVALMLLVSACAGEKKNEEKAVPNKAA